MLEKQDRVGEPVERPLLKPWYRLSVESGRSVLRYAGSVLEFEGAAAERLLPHLLPLLDGTRSIDDVVAELGEPARPAVDHALSLLRAHDLLTEGVAGSRCSELLAATTGRSVDEIERRLGGAEIHVLGSGPAAEETRRLLGPAGRLDWADDPPRSGFVVAAPSGAEVHLLSELNARFLAARTEWMQVLPFDGRFAGVGPVFVPGETACHECFLFRRDATIAAARDRARGRYPGSPAIDAVLAGLAAHTALRHVAIGGDAGTLLAVELAPDLRCTRHFVYRVPRCSACSTTSRRAALAPWSDVAA
ncbi:MAG: TOMM precursor leader peptide-binding protein [Acidobacteriota bacterium]|nr:TOMM precursor leader peptide-binding protein [Acidobacteriota bacterium]